MKNRMKVGTIIIFIFIIISIVYIIFTIPKKISTNIQVINQTQKNICTDINISLGSENSSNIYSIFSLDNIDSKSVKSAKKVIDNFQGDFGIVVKVEDSTNSFYYTSGNKLSQINITLEIVDTSDDNIIIHGNVTSKNLIGLKKSELIKPITIKGDTYE